MNLPNWSDCAGLNFLYNTPIIVASVNLDAHLRGNTCFLGCICKNTCLINITC